MSCYISPSIDNEAVLEILDETGDTIKRRDSPIIVGGDFNAASTMWGSRRTNTRGNLLEEWAAECDLRVVNVGCTPTCVRPQGESIVDVTWSSPDTIDKIRNWSVVDTETLSDHNYIVFEIIETNKKNQMEPNKLGIRWNWRKADLDIYQAVMIWSSSVIKSEGIPAEEYVNWTEKTFRNACDACTNRVHRKPEKPCMYWWNSNIAQMRTKAIRARRAWKRSRRIRGDRPEETNKFESEYRNVKKELRKTIGEAKNQSWKELIQTIEEDPWGLPYKLVLGRLRKAAVGMTVLRPAK